MGIGRNSFKKAKEKAKAEGEKIRRKGRTKPGPSPASDSKSFFELQPVTAGKTIRIGKSSAEKRASRKATRGSGITPINGNAFTGAMAKAGGDYDKAKAMLGDSPAAYGTGSPFKLMKDKKVTSVKSEGFKNKSVVSPQQGEYSYKGKKYRRDVDPKTQLKISGKIAKEQLSNTRKR
tara:strand:+ start:930 stop:1460 length:531 start_codon:yes stop_codon:yes gene_type:complete